jgi:hypothetical protein
MQAYQSADFASPGSAFSARPVSAKIARDSINYLIDYSLQLQDFSHNINEIAQVEDTLFERKGGII